ncbi:MAG: Asp-tRNA(Asn)/Glu-tRNA(Gln) amidotransferase subunit GatA [Akkermansiaceae bacterium]|nr:Asp-tRNA(Asn)/Glu-tRNA(Gln) amidotransferase subunit GatA [Akkermansiaceae bacterium]
MSPLIGTLAYWREELRRHRTSPSELIRLLAHKIEEKDRITHAYLSWNLEEALRQAGQADADSPLGGIPVAVKDNICVAGEPTRCASRFLSNYRSPCDAGAIVRLRRAGGIPFGRTNMDEFAMGASGENSAFGPTLNPRNARNVPGGSSSGSAAAVADGTAIAALGSDTGGSIRQPASHCGIVGLKPTYGRVSRNGLVAFASSLDQIGTLTQDVRDAALLLNAIAGHDPEDSTSDTRSPEDFTSLLGREVKGIRIGIPHEYSSSGNHPHVRGAVEKAAKTLNALGAEIIDISLPHSEAVVAAYYIIACAEASSNLSRFDGVRYGLRADDPKNLEDLYARSRAEGFGPEVKRRIILGTYVLSSGYYDAYYARAQKVRALIAGDFTRAFEQVDFILGPTAPTPAPLLHDADQTPLQRYLADIYTIPANLAGLPALSLPCLSPEASPDDLPTGIQLIAPHYREAKLLSIAYALEQSGLAH